jgi:CubicO group peptidase (beta-lactamase class C family)
MTSPGLDDPRKINVRRAYGHTMENGEYRNADNDKLAGIDAPGELYSTVRDLRAWCNALLNGALLSEEAERLMFTAYAAVDFDPPLSYGYGWFLGSDFRLSGGGTPGFRSEIWQYPDRKTNIIMLRNFEKVDSHKLLRTIKPLLI